MQSAEINALSEMDKLNVEFVKAKQEKDEGATELGDSFTVKPKDDFVTEPKDKTDVKMLDATDYNGEDEISDTSKTDSALAAAGKGKGKGKLAVDPDCIDDLADKLRKWH